MSYEPLHHKYRPQTFKDLVGQEAIASTLISAIESEKIAPAYLFTGPRGTGKTSSARILAKSLNCLSYDKPTPIPCGKCEVCQAIAVGNALDVIEIDAASNTGVDNIREIIERSRFAPVQSRYKVYAIDECHMLSTAAFNALLKTLEEPPLQVVFILATTDPQRVLSTIISRCQRFDYRRIRLDAMISHLGYIARQENIAIAPEALTLIAQIANGGLRDAESLLDQLSLFPQQITVEQIWDLVGAVPEKDLLALLTAIRKEDIEDIVAQCRNLLDRGREPLVLLQNLAGFYLNLLIAKTSPNRQDLVAVTETCWQQLCTEAQHWQSETILRGQQQLKEGEVQIKNTTQPRLWLEVTLLGLLNKVAVSKNAISVSVNSDIGKGSALHGQPEGLYSDRSTAKEDRNSPTSIQSFVSKNSNRAETRNIQNSTNTDNQNDQKLSNKEFLPQKETQSSQNISQPTPLEVSTTQKERVQQTTSVSNDGSSISTEEQATIWQQVVDCIHPPMTQALLRQHCHLISLNGSAALVGISSAPLHKMHKGKVSNIETAFAKVCQRKIKVTLEVASKDKYAKKRDRAYPSSQTQTPTFNSQNNIAPPANDPKSESQKTFVKDNLEPTQNITVESKETTKKTEPPTVLEFTTEKKTSVIENNPAITNISANNTDDSNDFTKAIELIAQKFDGEIIELQNSSQNIIVETETVSKDYLLKDTLNKTESEKNKESSQQTAKNQNVVINRQTISDYDDDDIPF